MGLRTNNPRLCVLKCVLAYCSKDQVWVLSGGPVGVWGEVADWGESGDEGDKGGGGGVKDKVDGENSCDDNLTNEWQWSRFLLSYKSFPFSYLGDGVFGEAQGQHCICVVDVPAKHKQNISSNKRVRITSLPSATVMSDLPRSIVRDASDRWFWPLLGCCFLSDWGKIFDRKADSMEALDIYLSQCTKSG